MRGRTTDPANVRALAAAVIVQAWQDMISPGRDADRQIVRAEAIQFLTADYGPFAESRAAWCDLADGHPGNLRTAAIDALALMRAGGRPIFRASEIAPRARSTDDENETEEESA